MKNISQVINCMFPRWKKEKMDDPPHALQTPVLDSFAEKDSDESDTDWSFLPGDAQEGE